MQGSDDIRDDVPDEVPVADAIEQQLPASEPIPDDAEASRAGQGAAPLEAPPPDWQEQHEEVDLDADSDEFDRG